ncbi:MAG: hypothetical protein QOJ50_2984 [Cryptosporangiaceae bacterium]|nr:hypothetical protein [Cryptosporangiaceae bacterium]
MGRLPRLSRNASVTLTVGAVLVGLTAIGTGMSFAGNQPGVLAGKVTPACAALTSQIKNRGTVNTAQAIQCDQAEFASMENARQQARAKGQKPPMGVSPTCAAVDARAATGDSTLDFTLAFHCRQQERFANATNVANGVAKKEITSLCQGVALRASRGQSVDRFQASFCSLEGANVGGGQNAPAPPNPPAPTPPAPKPPVPPAPKPPAPQPPAPPAPAPAPGGNVASVAPYVDLGVLSNGQAGSLADISKKTGLKNFALAFVTAAGCQPHLPDTDAAVKAQIDGLRAAGGDVIMSFGGASGAELAQACTDPAQLQAAYAGVVKQFGLKAIDMDVEGAAVADAASIARRSKALAAVQKQVPGLKVSLTLPVLPTGLTDGVNVVKSAKDNGLALSVVNVMAMDYGAADRGDRGAEAIQAAQSTLKQVQGIFGASANFSMIGVTPMLGVNDDQAIYNQDDARQLVTFAKQNKIGYLGFWELNRDAHACNGALFSCTNIAQQPLEFAKIFAAR